MSEQRFSSSPVDLYAFRKIQKLLFLASYEQSFGTNRNSSEQAQWWTPTKTFKTKPVRKNGVERQKTINVWKINGNGTNWLSQEISELSPLEKREDAILKPKGSKNALQWNNSSLIIRSTYGRKVPSHLKNRPEYPIKKSSKKQAWAPHAAFCYCSHEVDDTRQILTKQRQNQSFRDRTMFGIQYCESFSKSAKRENLDSRPGPQMQRNQFKFRSNLIHQHNGKKVVYPMFFIFIWTML